MDAVDVAQEKEADFLEARLRAQAEAAGLGNPGGRFCADCDDEIPAARRRVLPSATRCIDCATFAERYLNNTKNGRTP